MDNFYRSIYLSTYLPMPHLLAPIPIPITIPIPKALALTLTTYHRNLLLGLCEPVPV